jgi:hypothetical protein
MKVYVITQGCAYEGGSVSGVFITEHLAREKFNELIAEKRQRNKEMYEWEFNQDYGWEATEDERRERAEEWLEERTELDEDRETFIARGDYITLSTMEAL